MGNRADDISKTVFEKGELDDRLFRYDFLDHPGHYSLKVQPYMDILRGTDATLKKVLLHRIVLEWPNIDLELIKIALKDKDVSVRIQAGMALQSVEEKINSRIIDYIQKNLDFPEEVSFQIHLAKAYLDYLNSGFLEEHFKNYFVSLAEVILNSVNKHKVRIDGYWGLYQKVRARCELFKGDLENALKGFEQICKENPSDETSALILLGIQFKMENFSQISDWANKVKRNVDPGDSFFEYVELWKTKAK